MCFLVTCLCSFESFLIRVYILAFLYAKSVILFETWKKGKNDIIHFILKKLSNFILNLPGYFNFLAERRIRFSLKHSQLKGCLLALLSRCEMALPCFKRMLLVSPLLPDEYLLRADYPGARIRTKTKVWRFRVRASDTALMASSVDMASSRSSARQHTRLQRQLGYRPTGMTGSLMVQTSMLIGDSGGGEIQESGDEKMEMKVEYKVRI